MHPVLFWILCTCPIFPIIFPSLSTPFFLILFPLFFIFIFHFSLILLPSHLSFSVYPHSLFSFLCYLPLHPWLPPTFALHLYSLLFLFPTLVFTFFKLPLCLPPPVFFFGNPFFIPFLFDFHDCFCLSFAFHSLLPISPFPACLPICLPYPLSSHLFSHSILLSILLSFSHTPPLLLSFSLTTSIFLPSLVLFPDLKLVNMASECSWTDAVVELHVWCQLAAFCHNAKNHSLVLCCTKNALQLEEAAAKSLNTMPCVL